MSERLTDEVIERARLAREAVERARRRSIKGYRLYWMLQDHRPATAYNPNPAKQD